MGIIDKIKKLTNQLFPNGRAFKMPFAGELEKLRNGLAESEKRFYNDAVSLLDSALPDNVNFSADDATQWERRLGLITNTSIPLDDRKAAIRRKMNHPGGIPARQHYLFLERELRAAGFDVYVHENLSRLSPMVVTGGILKQLGDYQLGDSQLGGINTDMVANRIFKSEDDGFDIGSDYSNSFFIGGSVLPNYASVLSTRQIEFRELILRLKPKNQIAFLLINYI